MHPVLPVGVAPPEAGQAPSALPTAQFDQALTRALTTGGVVAAQHTRLSGSAAAAALERAWAARTGSAPQRETVAVLAAQWAHETGRGASMYNFNFGGIKGSGPSGLSVEQRTREGWGATETTIRDRFRAYRTAEEGAADYLALLEKRFPGAVEAAARGDSQGFARELKARGYFTGNEAAYARSLASLSSLALAQGFDAIGAGGGAPAALDLPVRPATSSAGAAAALSWEPDTPFVSALAIADELSRSAMRILGDERSDTDERRTAAHTLLGA